jgi:hypothetical protein
LVGFKQLLDAFEGVAGLLCFGFACLGVGYGEGAVFGGYGGFWVEA